jgi:two-component system CheB/CheR fusion protein
VLNGVSLLVLEDDPDTLHMFARSLAKAGAEVRTATTAEAALAILATWRPSAVLCDLHLPEVDGYDFLARLRETAALRDLPVIAISASHPSVEHALEAGFATHLLKPTKIAEIIGAVEALCQSSGSTIDSSPLVSM